MTIDEAIKHAEEVMVENLEKTKGRNASDPIAINCFKCAEEHQQLSEWLKELKQLREQTRWIPVSERLPEKYTYTLWCASSGYVRSDYFNGEFWEDAKKYCYEVVAWMPLPKPYKAESEG